MMTVIFPSGFCVQYNDAHYVERLTGFTDLYDKADRDSRRWIAQVPNDALIEVRPNCRTYNPLTDDTDVRLAEMARELKLLRRLIAKLRKVS